MKKFEITCGSIRVTDPCYNPGTWCAGEFPAKNGKWFAEIKEDNVSGWGRRISEIIIKHQDHVDADPDTVLGIDVGVDSGQAGFFDAKQYEVNHGGDYGDPRTFYGQVCDLTCGPERFGVIPFGAVSSSGFGDGSYRCFVENHDGVAVAAKIIFIGDEEFDEWNDDEEEE